MFQKKQLYPVTDSPLGPEQTRPHLLFFGFPLDLIPESWLQQEETHLLSPYQFTMSLPFLTSVMGSWPSQVY